MLTVCSAKRYERMLKSHGVNPHGGAWEAPTSYKRKSLCATYPKLPHKRKLDEDLDYFKYDDEEEDVKFEQKRQRAQRKPHVKQETMTGPNAEIMYQNGFHPAVPHRPYPYMQRPMPPYMHTHPAQAQHFLGMPYAHMPNRQWANNSFLPPAHYMPPPNSSMHSPTQQSPKGLFVPDHNEAQFGHDSFEGMLNAEFTPSDEPESTKFETEVTDTPFSTIKAEDTTTPNIRAIRDVYKPDSFQTQSFCHDTDDVAIGRECADDDASMSIEDVVQPGATVPSEEEAIKLEAQDDCICVD